MALSKKQVIEQAHQCGLEDIGFTTAEPFSSQEQILRERRDAYEWTEQAGIPLAKGTDPRTFLAEAKSIIVVVEHYFRKAFPPSMVGKFGRVYQDDDRIPKDGFTARIRSFLEYLNENGIETAVPYHMPHRMAGARAGLGTFGKNNFFYSNKLARKSSWTVPVPIIVDQEFPPDEPTVEVGCPEWCKNACIAAYPTRALKAPRNLDPRKCISYLSYSSQDLPPVETREQMGTWVYGCDRCQDVCPRNQPWLTQELPVNEKVAAKAESFRLDKLLHMDRAFFEDEIWPHMFYTPAEQLWLWHMNAARSMGNSLDVMYVPDLARALRENEDERVQCMCAWALGRIGGEDAKLALEQSLAQSTDRVREEVEQALAALTQP
jgi:epoxyqueuosine reductase